jgi:uncharacterized RDD family membrane protein YckC
MSVRFDEVELFKGSAVQEEPVTGTEEVELVPEHEIEPVVRVAASRSRRLLAFLTDASLFLALGLALSPLLDIRGTLNETLLAAPLAVTGFAAFLLLLSYYYFVATWVVWGKTVGGSIFDTRVAASNGFPIDVKSATIRWCGMLLSVLTGGLGFLIAIFPGGRSLADLMSRSRSYVSH